MLALGLESPLRSCVSVFAGLGGHVSDWTVSASIIANAVSFSVCIGRHRFCDRCVAPLIGEANFWATSSIAGSSDDCECEQGGDCCVLFHVHIYFDFR